VGPIFGIMIEAVFIAASPESMCGYLFIREEKGEK
jgi:hypothetical protein